MQQRVEDLLRRMTLEEKIGQMTQADQAAVDADPSRGAAGTLGSVLSGGGSVPTPNTPAGLGRMVEPIPVAGAEDTAGYPDHLRDRRGPRARQRPRRPVFPHNVGLGATRDPALVERVGDATATEVPRHRRPLDFAPCVCVSRDERWGRSYESFGEDPALVPGWGRSIDGLQGRRGRLADADRVLATAKHYAGDGDTGYDYGGRRCATWAGRGASSVTDRPGLTVISRADFAR